MIFRLVTILVFMVMLQAQAQRFEVVSESKNLKVPIGETIHTPIQIRNLTDEPLSLVIRRTDKSIGSTQLNYFCLDGKCYESVIDQLPSFYQIPPHETSFQFENVLETGLAEGLSIVKYIIYDRNNPAEAIEYEISYTVEDKKSQDVIYSSENLRLNDVYPNPVSEYAIIDYHITNRDIEAKITIHNVLGSIIGEYRLPYLENKLTIKTENLNPGVYFYTLHVDNDAVLTRKLIIRK